MKSGTLPLLVAASLCGCVSGTSSTSSASLVGAPTAPPPTAPAPPQTPAQQRTAAASTLAIEGQWLASWFKGTPVVVAQRPDGAVVVEVPREFCFDPGRDAVKPALAVVLDRVAESLRRTSIAELHLIAAPGDASGSATLGVQRATRVHDHLRSRGVSASRLAKPSTATGAAVQLRIEPASPA